MNFDRLAAAGFAVDLDMAVGTRGEIPGPTKVGESVALVFSGNPGDPDRDGDAVHRGDLGPVTGEAMIGNHDPALEHELAAIRHRGARKDRKMKNRRHQLTGIGPGGRDLGCQRGADLDLPAQRRPQQTGGLDEHRIDVDVARLRRLVARERPQLRRQVGATGGGLGVQSRNGREFRPVGDRLPQQLGGADDDREDIVEVMNDAAGEPADDLHPPILKIWRFRSFRRQALLKHSLEFPDAAALLMAGLVI